jgi:predicted RNA-binding protein YlxR (DUF448 family)
VACRTERAKRELVRVVRTAAGSVEIDPTGRLPGRGAYVCASGTCAAEAVRRGALERALGVPTPEPLRDRLTAGSLD